MRILALALAASGIAAVPALAAPGNGNAYGHDPKVCLVTFGTPAERMGQANVDVVKAQYLPLRIAMRKEAATDDVSDIYTYGPDRYTGPEVDFNYAGDSTEATCEYLDNLNDDDDDSDD